MPYTDQSDTRYRIEFSTDEPGALEALLTGGISIVANEALKTVLGDEHGWYCKITDSVTDLSECCWGPTKGEAQEKTFRALKGKTDELIENQERTQARQRHALQQQHESQQPKYRSDADDSSGAGCIVKLVVGLIVVAAIVWIVLAIVWVVFAVAIPLLVIDIAAIALVAGLIRKELGRFLLPLSVAGALLVVADYNQGWFTKALATNVPFLAGMIPVLLYINVLAGLIAAYLLIKTFMDKRSPPSEPAGEFTRRNLIAMGCLLLVGALTVGFQVRVDSQRRQARQSIAAANSVIENPVQSKRLNAEGLRILSAARPDFNAAKRVFEQAVQLEPNNVEALNNLGYVYGKLGDYRSAEPILIKVVEMAPTRKVTQGNLGEVEAKLGKTQDAANHFCQYVRLFSSLERGKSLLARTFTDPDPNVQAAVSSTLANCN